MGLTQLPQATVRLLASSQVITSISSVVKELMENSFDAGASNIEVRLEKHGLEKIEVKDDGCGVVPEDCLCIALPHYTSKINDFSDLDRVRSYGFRGEALYSLCSLASVTVTTKTENDELARTYVYDNSGNVIESKISHGLKGTTVVVKGLFKNIPVRRQVMSTGKRVGEELKKVEKVVKSLAVIHPRVRVSLAHNKFLIWQKTSVAHLKLSVMQILNHTVTRQLHHIVYHMEQQIKIELLIPKKDCDVQTVSIGALNDTFHLFVNKRPVRDKKVEKIFLEVFSSYFGLYIPPNKFPVCFVSLTLPPDMLDVNLEPNKSKIFIKDQDNILECVKEQLNLYYCHSLEEKLDVENCISKPKKRKVESSPNKKSKNTLKSPLKTINDEQIEKPVAISNDVVDVKENENCLEKRTVAFENNDRDAICEIFNNDRCVTSETLGDILSEVSSHKNEEILSHSDKNIEVFPQSSNGNNGNLYENHSLSVSSLSNLSLSGKSCESIAVSLDPEIVNDFLNSSSDEGFRKDFEIISDSSQLLSQESLSSEATGFKNYNCNDEISLSQWSRGNIVLGDKKVQGSSVLLNSDSVIAKENNLSDSCDKSVNNLNMISSSSIELVHDIETFLDSQEGNLLLQRVTSNTNNVSNSKKEISNSHNPEKNCTESKNLEKQNTLCNEAKNERNLTHSNDSLNNSVSSQMGKKEMSAFTKFAQDMRSEILKESPGMSFTLVASTLASKWKNLQAEEKERYEKVVNNGKFKKKEQVETPNKNRTTEKMASPKTPKHFNRSTVYVTVAKKFNLKTYFEQSSEISFGDNIINIVGQIESSDLWLYSRVLDEGKTEIGVLSVLRLQEAIKYHQNMETMEIPVKSLEEAIYFSESDLGTNLWNVLMALEFSFDETTKIRSISDKKIVMNGFRINIIQDEREVAGFLTDVAMNINFYGLEDLQQTLEIIHNKGEECTVGESRCLNAVKYIRSESIRQCSLSLSPLLEKTEVFNLVNLWWNECHRFRKCPHSKDVIFPFRNVPN